MLHSLIDAVAWTPDATRKPDVDGEQANAPITT
jgi:hypothetical protein